MRSELAKTVEALKKAKQNRKNTKFKQSVELVINVTGVDLTKPQNRFSEVIELPNDLGRKRRKILVIASGNLALEASKTPGVARVIQKEELEALVGRKKEAKKIAAEYDFVLVEPALVGLAARVLGAALGARGKTPIPIPPGSDIQKLVKRYENSVVATLRKSPQVACLVGVEEDPDEKIAENVETVLNRVVEKLEKKRRNIASVYVKTTMGKPVKVEF
ncbi:large subunit ribosomal protein L1 [Candidatus Caldarchaeum subterraneum]|mgnify:CR=1 FL=1|uniref:Large ribosomal subunit protein uL1 n=2 Tax=Thermoproteati TaxID=1783275 RepID=H5SJ25_9CREN|nr:large subunit ribosomal protein L1 [Candidatus Caldarchaeum subterraneum]BAJ49099.1 large subunit ribosomal protein L1 [Candidatus Caldarchaeum subterraneum]BAJ49116.1 large subunit ribosomal protein L1 [Candidatus Caldarchaeum subterraneum]BAJ50019.1 large subunit ribosomal protein L1 [Candidatus Caldarchaeum subterraneum]BAL56161.1 50S ribosomal protein L1 [uncultured crenarchaeote]